MHEIYWSCLIGGALFALVVVLVGDLIGHVFDGFLDFMSMDHLDFMSSTVIVGGITVFGGTGVMLSKYSSLDMVPVAVLSMTLSVCISTLLYFAYVRPMKNSENSTAYSAQELVGKIGEVNIPIPSKGFGEVVLRVGAGNTNQIAGSFDGEELHAGTKVVVGEVKEGILYVFPYELN